MQGIRLDLFIFHEDIMRMKSLLVNTHHELVYVLGLPRRLSYQGLKLRGVVAFCSLFLCGLNHHVGLWFIFSINSMQYDLDASWSILQ